MPSIANRKNEPVRRQANVFGVHSAAQSCESVTAAAKVQRIERCFHDNSLGSEPQERTGFREKTSGFKGQGTAKSYIRQPLAPRNLPTASTKSPISKCVYRSIVSVIVEWRACAWATLGGTLAVTRYAMDSRRKTLHVANV